MGFKSIWSNLKIIKRCCNYRLQITIHILIDHNYLIQLQWLKCPIFVEIPIMILVDRGVTGLEHQEEKAIAPYKNAVRSICQMFNIYQFYSVTTPSPTVGPSKIFY